MILGIDSSAISAGCAVTENGKIVAEEFLNTRHTHSETLLPMVKSVLDKAGVGLRELEAVAVSCGPGSFTGLRIGISCVKGLCDGAEVPCVGISTLEAIAYNFVQNDGVVCACMDARCRQVYNALFRVSNGSVTRLCGDRAVSMQTLSDELDKLSGQVVLAGDGAELMYEFTGGKYTLASPALRFQRGYGVCFAAEGKPRIPCEELMPTYLRLPQAERERLAKLNKA